MLNIPSNICEEMVTHAKEDFPFECCGILGGKDDSICHLYKVKNSARSKVSYLMDPREQIRIFKEMRTLGIELRAVYHSHPNHPPYPSKTDVELAYYPEAVYMIISINDSMDTNIRGFRIINGEITEVDLKFLHPHG